MPAVGLTVLAISWRKGGALSPVQATTVIVCAIASVPFGFTVLQHTPTGQLFLLPVVWIVLGWQLARQSNRLQAPRTHANN